MILMPQIFDVTASENVRYKRNELEFVITASSVVVLDINRLAKITLLGTRQRMFVKHVPPLWAYFIEATFIHI